MKPLHYLRSMLSVGNAQSVRSAAIQSRCTMHSWGTWCSGITFAPHAEGPGLKSQCVHCFHSHRAMFAHAIILGST